MTHGVFERVCEGCTQCLIQGKGIAREGRHTRILEFMLIIILEVPFPRNLYSFPAVDAEVPFGKKSLNSTLIVEQYIVRGNHGQCLRIKRS